MNLVVFETLDTYILLYKNEFFKTEERNVNMTSNKFEPKIIKSIDLIGDILITDPCYIIKENKKSDWELCQYGKNMKALGIEHCVVTGTLYGDWLCEVLDDKGYMIGEFTADSGLVGVFLLNEVYKYNPNYDLCDKMPYTATIIKNFSGKIDFVQTGNDELELRGYGTPFNFTTHNEEN